MGRAKVLCDGEALPAGCTLQVCPTLKGNLAGPGDELDELCAFLRVEGADRPPEPLDLGRGDGVGAVVRVGAPVVEVNVGETGDEKL